jgi:hypothetical protein
MQMGHARMEGLKPALLSTCMPPHSAPTALLPPTHSSTVLLLHIPQTRHKQRTGLHVPNLTLLAATSSLKATTGRLIARIWPAYTAPHLCGGLWHVIGTSCCAAITTTSATHTAQAYQPHANMACLLSTGWHTLHTPSLPAQGSRHVKEGS